MASMARTSTKVFVLEVMGRHAGWMAAAGGLAGREPGDAPHIILFPEIAFDREKFLARVKAYVERYGYCVIVVSEGVRDAAGNFLAEAGTRDAFGHSQLGGVGPVVAQMTRDALGYKFHWAVADYLQRSARHIASRVDVEQAYAVGKAAVEFAVQGKNGRHADHRPQVRHSPIAGASARRRSRKIANAGKKGAAQLHHGGRLRHHRGLPPLPVAADRRRGLPALPQRPARLCAKSRASAYRRRLNAAICGIVALE